MDLNRCSSLSEDHKVALPRLWVVGTVASIAHAREDTITRPEKTERSTYHGAGGGKRLQGRHLACSQESVAWRPLRQPHPQRQRRCSSRSKR